MADLSKVDYLNNPEPSGSRIETLIMKAAGNAQNGFDSVDLSSLAKVAFSGSYNDLVDKPASVEEEKSIVEGREAIKSILPEFVSVDSIPDDASKAKVYVIKNSSGNYDINYWNDISKKFSTLATIPVDLSKVSRVEASIVFILMNLFEDQFINAE